MMPAENPFDKLLTIMGNITYLQVTFTSKTGGYYEVNTYGNNPESDYGTFTFR